jgi:hypothetical protein
MAADHTVLTYATHAHGRFAALRKAVPGLVVGGWGTPWGGYLDKLDFVLAHARGVADDPGHVLVFLDGFDTEVRLPPAEAVRRFRAEFGGCRVLLSYGALESALPRLARRRLFGAEGDVCCNTGMYMGYAPDVARLLDAARRTAHGGNDQTAVELARAGDPTVAVDVRRRVFHNLGARERAAGGADAAADAVFLGYNATADATLARKALGYAAPFAPDVAVAAGALAAGAALPHPAWPVGLAAGALAQLVVLSPARWVHLAGLGLACGTLAYQLRLLLRA